MFLDLHLYKLFPATGENCGKSFSQVLASEDILRMVQI